MLSEVRQKKIMEKLNRAQKCSILGPQNLGSGGGPGPRGPPPGSAPGCVPASRLDGQFGSRDLCRHANERALLLRATQTVKRHCRNVPFKKPIS